jgi:hypothetical protein
LVEFVWGALHFLKELVCIPEDEADNLRAFEELGFDALKPVGFELFEMLVIESVGC